MKEFTYVLKANLREKEIKRLLKLTHAHFDGCRANFNEMTGRLTVCTADTNDTVREEKRFLDATSSAGFSLTRISERTIPGMSLLALDREEDRAADGGNEKRPRRNPTLTVVLCLLLSVVCVLSTWAVTSAAYDRKLAELGSNLKEDSTDTFAELDFLNALFQKYSYYDLDEEALVTAVLKAYTAATGDRYAQYYTKEEFAALNADNAGDVQGIGVSVVNTTAQAEGTAVKVIQIISVFKDSPAMTAGLKTGDLIVALGTGEDRKSVETLGYDMALSEMRGEVGTNAEFLVWRPNGDGTYESIPFSVKRDRVVSESVTAKVSAADNRVGIVRILQFDLTTPVQFRAAMTTLQSAGCEYFIFDVRNNPGGDLKSIEAVLSYFLQEGDLIVSTKDSLGNTTEDFVKAVTYSGDYASCSVLASEIGCYRGIKAAVLTNGNTASAAELFTATMRDYSLATLVGTKTFGKGCMQSVLSLAPYGYEGGVKLTTRMYFSKCGVSYHDIGITPNQTVELSEEASSYNIFLLPESLDNQLAAAIAAVME